MQIKNILLVFVAICTMTSYAYAENHTDDNKKKTHTDANITGHIINKTTQEHIPFITISIKGTTISALSDESGHFFLRNLPVGEFVLTASGIGYTQDEIPVKLVKNKTLEINLNLEEQPLSLNQIVVSATKNETNRKSAPNIVNVMSAKLFETNAASSMSESMNFQSGLRMENNCGNCSVPQLRINGLDGKYSQILLDSRSIFSSLASVYSLEQLPVSMIERIEVVRGGGSALFGSSAIGGVVNIITKEPLRNTLSIGNTTNIAQGGALDMNTTINGAFVSNDNKAGVYLFGMIKNKDAYDRNGDGFSDTPTLKSETIGFRGYYKTSLFTKITAEYHHIHEFRRGGDLLELPPHQANIAEQLNHLIDGGGLKFDAYTRNQKHRFQVYASGQNIHRDSYFGTEQNPDAYGTTKDITAVAGGQYIFSADKFLFAPSNLTIGVEYSHNTLKDKIMGYHRDLHQYTNVAGAFIQNEWKTDKFNLLIGGRFDKHNKVKNVIFSPRVNIRYSPMEAVGLRASYSSGYLAPQAYNEDLHVAAVGGKVSLIEQDPNLRPEYSHSINASADLYHSFGKVHGNLLIEGFYTTINDVFTLVEKGTDNAGNIIFMRENAAGATVTGVNLEAKLGIPSVFEIQVGYTFQQSRYKEPFAWSDNPLLAPQKKMFRSPDQYGYITSNVNITPQFIASVFGNYTGKMLVQHAAGYVPQDTERITPSFFDMGFKLSYDVKLTDALTVNLFGGMKNILDHFQEDIDKGPLKDGAYFYGPASPRTFFVGLKFSL